MTYLNDTGIYYVGADGAKIPTQGTTQPTVPLARYNVVREALQQLVDSDDWNNNEALGYARAVLDLTADGN